MNWGGRGCGKTGLDGTGWGGIGRDRLGWVGMRRVGAGLRVAWTRKDGARSPGAPPALCVLASTYTAYRPGFSTAHAPISDAPNGVSGADMSMPPIPGRAASHAATLEFIFTKSAGLGWDGSYKRAPDGVALSCGPVWPSMVWIGMGGVVCEGRTGMHRRGKAGFEKHTVR